MNSPWGHVQHQEEVASGVLLVSTAGHGGFMVSKEAMGKLHPALKFVAIYGGKFEGQTCFEEDCEAVAVVYELQEKGIDLGSIGFKPVTKQDVISYLGRGDTYQSYIKARGL